MAAAESRRRFLEARDAREAELNPQRNPFAEAGDSLVTTGLRSGLPVAAAVLSAETGPGMVPIAATAGAIGNRLANIYEEQRGYAKPQKTYFENLKEDINMGAIQGAGVVAPGAVRIPGQFLARSPVKGALIQGAGDVASGAVMGAGLDAGLQLSETGELDPQRLATMGLMAGGMSGLVGLNPAMDTLRRGRQMQDIAIERAAERAMPVNQMPDYVPPAEPVPALPAPKSTSKTTKAVTERMAAAETPEQKLAILKQEVKLRGDTLTKDEQRAALDAQNSLESQIAKQDAAQEKVDTATEAQEAQVAAIEKQQKQQEDLLKAQQKVEMEQVKAQEAANKQQQDAIAEQQRVAEEAEKATQLLEPKPIVLANAAATAAKAIEDQPGTAQGVLNQISSAAQPEAPQMAQPIEGVSVSNPQPAPVEPKKPAKDIVQFARELQERVQAEVDAAKVPEDFNRGDELYTATGAPVKFVSGTIRGRVIVEMRDGSTASMLRKDLLVEPPSKESALTYIAGKWKTYPEFVEAVAKRGYDENDGIREIWNATNPDKAQLKAIPKDTQFLYKEGKNTYYQVDRTPENPRGRTVDRQTLKAEGYDVSQLPKEGQSLYSKSSTQVTLAPEDAAPIQQFVKSIPEADIYTDPKDPTVGRETESHITALYGITNNNVAAVQKALRGVGPITVTLGETSLFKNADKPYDVLKVEIDSPQLKAVNKLLKKGTKNSSDFPNYTPHLTLAYIKKGQADKYAGSDMFAGKEITFNSLQFKGKDGQTVDVPLTGAADDVKFAADEGDTPPPPKKPRNQRGAVEADILQSIAGTGIGGAYGFVSTEKREDETDEQFQARRLKNTLAWAAGGAAAGFGASKALGGKPARVPASGTVGGQLVNSRVARSLGMVVEHKPIMERLSDTALTAEKWKNIILRGSAMRKPFFDSVRNTQHRIMGGLAETVTILNDMRRKVVTRYDDKWTPVIFNDINDVFMDISKVDILPVELREDAKRMFSIRAKLATEILSLQGLTEATRDTIAENGGNYLARQYAIFDLKNERELRAYKEGLPKADIEAALDAIQETWKPPQRPAEERKLAADTIEFAAKNAVGGSNDAVAVIKSFRPWMTDNDAAKIAAWVAGGKQPGLPAVRALYDELINPTDVTRDEANFLLNQFLDRNQFGPFSVGRKEIGGKDVTSLYKRQEIDPRLRKVLGEVKDPLKNAYRTVENQVGLIERDRQQREMVQIGEKLGIMTKDADEAAAKGFQPFIKAGTQLNGSYDNWDGVYIDPVFREEFQGLFAQSGMEDNLAKKLIGDPIRFATGVFKWMKIIPSTDSRSINALGAYLNNVQNGRALNPLGKGYRDGTKALLTQAGLLNPDGGLNGAAINSLVKVMTEQGIMDESSIGRDFQDNLRNGVTDKILGKIDTFLQNEIKNPTARKAALALRFEASGGEFAAADTVARIAGFVSERADYRKVYPDLPDSAIDELAGRAMRMTGMIYSEVPHAMRMLSGYSVLPAFINFPYATTRAAINSTRLGMAEVQEGRETGNSVLLRKGARRLASLALVTAAASGGGIAYWMNKSNEITDAQEDAARRLGPSYIQNSPIAFDGPIKNGRASIIEQSYLLPNAMLTAPVTEGVEAGREGGSFWKGLERAAEVGLEPYLGGSDENAMGFGPVIGTFEQIRNNKNEFGEKIFNPEDPKKNEKIAKYILNKFAPAGFSKGQRVAKALSENPVGTSGQVYSLEEELWRTAGRRATTIDARVVLPRRAADLYARYTDAGKLYGEAVRKNAEMLPDEVAGAYQGMTTAQEEVFSDLVQLYNDALAFGLNPAEVIQGMKMAAVPSSLVGQIAAAQYIPVQREMLDQKAMQRQILQQNYRAPGMAPAAPQQPAKKGFVPYK